MPQKMDKKNVIYGPVDADKVDWNQMAKVLEKEFKANSSSFRGNNVKKLCPSVAKNKSVKGAYAKLGQIGNQMVLRIKKQGKLTSSHIGDDVVIKDIKSTQSLITALDKLSFDKMMKLKPAREVYKDYGCNPRHGAIGNEIGFWEIASNPDLPGDKKQKIYELYVKTDSKYEINISGSTRKKLTQLADEEKWDDMDFTRARAEIFSMLSGNHGSLVSMLTDYCWNKFWK